MTHNPQVANREPATPAQITGADKVTDVIVIGGGGGGLPVALFSRWLGDEVILIEKAPELGGTAKKAAFWYWVPNNEPLRAAGGVDTEADFLHYVARLSKPAQYNPESPTLGVSEWEYSQFKAIYESASPAAELLKDRGALPYRHVPGAVDYWSELPEDKAPAGRVLIHEDAAESMADGGQWSIRSMAEAARRDGVDIRTGCRAQRLLLDGQRVVGVEATNADGSHLRLVARKAVVFATGGFTHDADLRLNYLSVPAFAGCAVRTNEGDFLRIATPVGAQPRNMNHAWMCPVPLEKSVNNDDSLSGMFSVAGDSMIFINKYGKRAANEKLQYNELAREFFTWDAQRAEYPNLVMIALWDQRSQDHSAGTEFGNLIAPPGTDSSHVIVADTFEELTVAVGERLADYSAATGGLELADGFGSNLKDTIERFNSFAREGVDADFHRGERAVQLMFNGAVKDEKESRNRTMYPISSEGPYYASLVVGGTLDTKGGPKTNTHGQVLDDTDKPIPGLYGVGNCVASASGPAYWAGGATLGPIIAFAYRTAQAATQETTSPPAVLAMARVG